MLKKVLNANCYVHGSIAIVVCSLPGPTSLTRRVECACAEKGAYLQE